MAVRDSFTSSRAWPGTYRMSSICLRRVDELEAVMISTESEAVDVTIGE